MSFRINQSLPIVDNAGRPTSEFLRAMNNAIQGAVAAGLAQAAAAAAQTAADTAQTAADTAATAAAAAQTAADTAQASADGAQSQTSVLGSYPQGITITATDAGSNVTVAISSHTRVYSDGSTVSVSGGSITALSYSTTYYLYYDDPTHAGGSVTYHATTSADTAAQVGDRHTLGKVVTPAAAAPPATGSYVRGPGIGSIA